MNKSKKRIGGSMAVGAIIAMVIAAPASATLQTLDVVLETDKTVYRLPHPPLPTWSQYYPGDDVQITVSLHNNSDQELTFYAYGGGKWGIYAYAYETAAGVDPMYLLRSQANFVWLMIDGNPTGPEYTWMVMAPGAQWQYTVTWDLTNYVLGQPVEAGQYELVFAPTLPQEYESIDINWSGMSKWITVVPEPGTLSLLAGLAAVGLLRKGRRRPGKRPSGQTLKGAGI